MCEISERIEERGRIEERKAQRKRWLRAVINLASYFVSTVSENTTEQIKDYILNQKKA